MVKGISQGSSKPLFQVRILTGVLITYVVKKGDLVRIIAPSHVCWDLAGQIGVVIEYLSVDRYNDWYYPNQPIVVVLVGSYITFFYEEEVEILPTKE